MMSDVSMDEQLQAKLERLQQELEEKDKNLELAAKYGQDLLERNSDLMKELEKNNTEFSNRLEVHAWLLFMNPGQQCPSLMLRKNMACKSYNILSFQALEQDKYSLQLKISQRNNLEAAYEEDIEILKMALSKEREKHQTQIDTEFAPKISSLNQQVCLQTLLTEALRSVNTSYST